MKIIKLNKIDNSAFPIRKVASVRVARQAGPANLSHILTLECGHEVGVKKGGEVPTEVPCYWCHKDAQP